MNISINQLKTGLLLLVAGSWLAAGAQSTENVHEAAVVAIADSMPAIAPVENALLWEISGKNLQQPSYLYGTIHLIPQDSFFILPEVEQAMAASSRLVLEVALDGSAIFASALGMMMVRPSLSDLLAPEDYAYLKHFMQDSLSTPLPMFQMIKPLFIAQHISSNYCAVQESTSYEMYFMEVFQKMQKPLSGLETAKEQMKYLDAISLEEQAQNLMETVRNPRLACDQFNEMVRMYRAQDLAMLAAYTQEDPEMGQHLDQLLDARNMNWISPIEEMAARESVFIAVGAGHLPGPNGVISLLRKQGYLLKPLPGSH
jgi:uncharacterized protein